MIEIQQELFAEAVERACKCTLPDSIEITMLAVLDQVAAASREIVEAHCYGDKLHREEVRLPLVDLAAVALLMVARIDAGAWPDAWRDEDADDGE
ncbi:MAG: hypothetical protein WC977_11695 [Anaerovoracaceae bacterium]